MKSHVLVKHVGIKYDCDECAYQASIPRALQHPKMSVHMGVRYSCNECDFSTVQEYRLTAHKKKSHAVGSETNSKILVSQATVICEECGHTSTDKYELKKHMQGKHGDMRYQCDLCLFRTGWIKSLKRHREEKHG